MKKIAVILGTRPEAIKLLPVYTAFKDSPEFETLLVSTGQHREMLQQIFDFFQITPDIELNVMQPNQTLSTLSATLMTELDKLYSEQKFDAVVVQGDTTTCMIGSLVAFYHQISVLHVEAGLRTYHKFSPFPEEINRKITGAIADFHFAPTQQAKLALQKELLTENVFVVGNSVIDSLLLATEKVNSRKAFYDQHYAKLLNGFEKTVLITGHRRENFGEGFQNICEAIAVLADQYPAYSFIYPVHLNPNVQKVVYPILKDYNNIFLIEPVPYDHMVYLLNASYIIMTDSGGIQEEAPILGKPVIVLRNTTERPEGVDAGCSVLAGTDKVKIVSLFQKIDSDQQVYRQMSNAINPYGDGSTSKQIVAISKDKL
jgi:UDP-N-acetylglucosamine 2-epimerase (non-hydrolysing)